MLNTHCREGSGWVSLYGQVSFSHIIFKTMTKCNWINGDVKPTVNPKRTASKYVWAVRSSSWTGCNPSPSSSNYWIGRGFKAPWRLVGQAPTAAIVFTAPVRGVSAALLVWATWCGGRDWIGLLHEVQQTTNRVIVRGVPYILQRLTDTSWYQ